MQLHQLLNGLDYTVVQEVRSFDKISIKNIACNSKCVERDSIFFCFDGREADWCAYQREACRKGAVVLIIDKMVKHGKLLNIPSDITILLVKDAREAYANVSANYFGFRQRDFKLIGITGTKGKTTVAVMVKTMLETVGEKVGFIGTLGIYDGEQWFSSKNTTPDAFTIHKYFDKMKGKGCNYVVMEISSQGIKQSRIAGLEFETAVFTNLGMDHIGASEHASFWEYRYYKSKLFSQCKKGICNLDDLQSGYMFRRMACEKYGYTCQQARSRLCEECQPQILRAERIEHLLADGVLVTRFQVGDFSAELFLPGVFNVYNALAALQTMSCLGYDMESFIPVLKSIQVEGRMEYVPNNKKIACYIDYAHNGMSIQQVLSTVRIYNPRNVILVFGCGGNRSKDRRMEMGEAAGRYADHSIITMDNPRFEKPDAIAEEIVTGIQRQNRNARFEVILDRKKAIAKAVSMANAGDVVIVAGKGHEKYQEINGIRYFSDDHVLIREVLEQNETDVKEEWIT